MSVSLYEVSVRTYLQLMDGLIGTMEKAGEHFAEVGTDTQAVVDFKLKEDMLPFSFQIRSVVHHSRGALQGLAEGSFAPPPAEADRDYDGWLDFLRAARADVAEWAAEAVDSREDAEVVFRLSGMEIPFNGKGFILGFSLPNFYFHVTTAYDMLRVEGASIGKMDYLGSMNPIA